MPSAVEAPPSRVGWKVGLAIGIALLLVAAVFWLTVRRRAAPAEESRRGARLW